MNHGELDFLTLAVVLLGAAVVSVPIARGIRLSAIVAYLAAGVVIGPFGLGVFRAPETIVAVAELGVVLLLFVIGLELKLSRLLAIRRDIFGLGAAQFVLTASALAGLALASGLTGWRGAIVAGLALAMSATSIALRILEERGHLHETYGQRAFAILLFQDMSIVPVLAAIPLLAPGSAAQQTVSLADTMGSAALGAGAIAAVVVAGRYLLNPLFRLLAGTGAREVMTAAALLIVLGAAALMHAVGMSMALGAFLAGVLLAESNYRHELEADIEPFRGLLLALFFMGVGMSIDMKVVWGNLWLIAAAALAITLLKSAIVWGLFRITCARGSDALRAGSVLTPASEFAFVLIPLGLSLALLDGPTASLLSATAAATMLIGPPFATLSEMLVTRLTQQAEREPDNFDGLKGSVLLIGFGRFGQLVSQCLLAQGTDVTAIDNDAEMIQSASRFGFKVYYGDGTRLDVLRAAGVNSARVVAICVDKRDDADRMVELVRAECPGAKLFVRSFDRAHTLKLIRAGVDYELRETYESALAFGKRTLVELGVDEEEAQAVQDDVRRRDLERLALQQAEGQLMAGIDLIKRPVPEPLRAPARQSRPLNPEADDIIHSETEFSG